MLPRGGSRDKLERVDFIKTKYLVSEHVFLSKPNCLFDHFPCDQPLMRIKYFLDKLKLGRRRSREL